jgi:hypothetical protein
MIIKGVPGNQKVFRQIRNIPTSINRGIMSANKLIGLAVTSEAKRTMLNDPKTGKQYFLQDFWTRTWFLHKASAIGESPAKFSGSLIASLGYVANSSRLTIGAGTVDGNVPIVRELSALGKARMPGQIGFGRVVDYASSLELGGRPYLKPSIKKEQKNTENYYRQLISRELIKK